MPVTQLGNDTTTVLADGPDFVMERVFEANAFHCVENFLDVPHTAHAPLDQKATTSFDLCL